jgi:lipoprotein-anchoring transpeptidase ErfK/SrfK
MAIWDGRGLDPDRTPHGVLLGLRHSRVLRERTQRAGWYHGKGSRWLGGPVFEIPLATWRRNDTTGGVWVATGSRSSVRKALSCPRHAGKLIALVVLLLGALLPVAAGAQAWTPPQTVFVPRTGHTTDGLFLELWQTRRSLIGDPITEELRAKTGLGEKPGDEQIVQYYENAALVYLPEQPAGEQVRLLDLGSQSLKRALENHPTTALTEATRRTACARGPATGCTGFQQTGHAATGAFGDFWNGVGGESLLGRPITEPFRAADGSWTQYFERAVLRAEAGRGVEPMAVGIASARALKLETGRVVRPLAVPLYAATLFIAPPAPDPDAEVAAAEAVPEADATEPDAAEPDVASEPAPEPDTGVEPAGVADGSASPDFGPGPQQGGDKEIVVSISAEQMWAYESGQLVNSSLVSTGTAQTVETSTPIGFHSILTKLDSQTMEGTISGQYYRVEDVPYVMYFDDLGNALHGTYWHNNFGAPMSHGCVNLPMDVAAWMYDWAPVGTPVTVVP